MGKVFFGKVGGGRGEKGGLLYLFVAMTIWCILLSYCFSLLGIFFRRRELGVLDSLLELSIQLALILVVSITVLGVLQS